MAVIGEMHYLTIGNNTYSIPVSGGTVTNVRVQATSPVQSSSSSEQTVALDTTISLADAYGDTKNPYGTKTANYVLAGPTSGSSRVPSFRQLVAADIPDLSASYLPASTSIPTKVSDLTNDSGFVTTDEKLALTESNSTGLAANPIFKTGQDTAATRQYSGNFIYRIGTGSQPVSAALQLGNNQNGNNNSNRYGAIDLYGTTAYKTQLNSGSPTADRTISLPNKDGTVALTTDIPTATSDLTNDSNFTSFSAIVSSTQPTTQLTGDLWFKVVTT